MSNIVKTTGSPPKRERMIRDMHAGEQGYTVEWAVVDGELNDGFAVSPTRFGTMKLLVECVARGKYAITWSDD